MDGIGESREVDRAASAHFGVKILFSIINYLLKYLYINFQFLPISTIHDGFCSRAMQLFNNSTWIAHIYAENG